MMRQASLLAFAMLLPCIGTTRAADVPAPARHVEMVNGPNGVVIETFVQGSGPAIVMLPSTGRDGAEDFDDVAARLAADGFTVLRPLGNGRAVILGHAFGHFVARMAAVDSPAKVRGVVLAAAAAASYAPDIAATPGIAGDLARPEAERLAALRLGFFAPGHDPTPWLKGWWPAAQRVQVNSREKAGVKQSDWWSAGTAPLLELIPASDPFKPRDKWDELKQSYGDRVTTVMIPDASHALFPEQPKLVADAVAAWVRTLPP